MLKEALVQCGREARASLSMRRRRDSVVVPDHANAFLASRPGDSLRSMTGFRPSLLARSTWTP